MIKQYSKKTGLFFGSFNPIHIGHLVVGEYMVENTDLDEFWFIISPHNPLKEKKTLLADHHRLAMVNMAIEDDARFQSSNIEFKMPRPSYTIDTLTYLQEKHPKNQFVLISGTDIFPSFHKWKNYQELLSQHQLYIYMRPAYEPGKYADHDNIQFFNAPLMEISASFIRQSIRDGKDVKYMLPEKVYAYIKEMHFYKR